MSPLAAQPRPTLRPLVIPDREPRMMCLRAEHEDAGWRSIPMIGRTFVFLVDSGVPMADPRGPLVSRREVTLVTDSTGALAMLQDQWVEALRAASAVIVVSHRDSTVGVRSSARFDSATAARALASRDVAAARSAVTAGPQDTLPVAALDRARALGAWLFARRCGR